MIVQCEQCRTKFNVADDKIAAKGTSVRCSKCKHVFKVFPAERMIPPPQVPNTPAPLDNSQLGGDLLPPSTDYSNLSAEELFGGPTNEDLSSPSEEELAISPPTPEPSKSLTPPPNITMEIARQTIPPENDSMEVGVVAEFTNGPNESPNESNDPQKVEKNSGVQLPKAISLKSVSRNALLGFSSDQVAAPSQNRLLTFLKHTAILLLVIATTVLAFSLRGIKAWRWNELLLFWHSGWSQNATSSGIEISDYHARQFKNLAYQDWLLIEGRIINHDQQTHAAPNLHVTITDGSNQQQTQVFPCCWQPTLISLRSIVTLEALQNAQLNNSDKKPLSESEERPFTILLPVKSLPKFYKVEIQP